MIMSLKKSLVDIISKIKLYNPKFNIIKEPLRPGRTNPNATIIPNIKYINEDSKLIVIKTFVKNTTIPIPIKLKNKFLIEKTSIFMECTLKTRKALSKIKAYLSNKTFNNKKKNRHIV